MKTISAPVRVSCLLALTVALAVGGPRRAGPALRQEEAVTAEAVLERYVEATGGHAAWGKLQTRVSNGTVLFTSMGTVCLLTIRETRSTDRWWRARSESLGVLLKGSTGDAAWEWSLLAGPRLEKGAALASTLRTAPLDAPTRWKEQFEKLEYTGTGEVDGARCHMLHLTPAGGEPETRYYDATSGLHVRTEALLDMEGHAVPGVLSYGDYREVDGVLLPHSTREALADMEEIVTKLDEIVHGVDLPPAAFEPPVEIRALLDRK